jgi:4-hydroxybenzoate polyprenyltransferase
MSELEKQRLTFLKVIALLLQVRWYNIALLASAQYLASVGVMNDPHLWKHTLLDFRLHLIVLASLFIISGGFIINNFYDHEKDLINRPQQTVFERLISKGTVLNLYFVFNALGLLLAYAVSWRALAFFLSYSFGLWLYSHKLKKIMGFGNLSAAFLTIMPFFGIFFYYEADNWLLMVYVVMMIGVVFSREVVKDVLGIKGDLIYGYPTIPATLGFQKSKWVIAGGLFAVPVLSLWMLSFAHPILRILLYVANFVVLVALIFMIRAKKRSQFAIVNTLLKTLIIGSVFSLLFFRP